MRREESKERQVGKAVGEGETTWMRRLGGWIEAEARKPSQEDREGVGRKGRPAQTRGPRRPSQGQRVLSSRQQVVSLDLLPQVMRIRTKLSELAL